jgi:hypothetical protein
MTGVLYPLFLLQCLGFRPLPRWSLLVSFLQVPGGGGGKRDLWVIDADKSPCLGKVGANNNKFCVKPRLEGLLHCGKGRHSVKFQPTKNVAYIK